MELCHRVLKIISKQELINKSGFSLTEEEDQIRFRLQAMETDFNAPNQFKVNFFLVINLGYQHKCDCCYFQLQNRLYELMSQISMKNTNSSKPQSLEFKADDETLHTIKRVSDIIVFINTFVNKIDSCLNYILHYKYIVPNKPTEGYYYLNRHI